MAGKKRQLAEQPIKGISGSEKGEACKKIPAVETWAISLQDIYDNAEIRLDASHYNRHTASAIQELEKSNFPLKQLSDLAEVRLPSQFVRVWADDIAYGYPYVNATDLMSLTGLGTLSGNARFLSKETETDVDELIIHEGWLLMTCSGTIGRIFYVPKRLDGWVATHDLIRIIPQEEIPVGFLHAYLSSPVAQRQIVGYIHGGQIDHVTHHQINEIYVPILPKESMFELHQRTMEALEKRESAIEALATIASDTQQIIK